MTTKTIKIDELKNNFPSDFDREYEVWQQRASFDIDIFWPDWAEEMAKNILKGTGWEHDNIGYSIGFCQGDHVSIEARFHIEDCSDDQIYALKGDFPMLVECMKQGWMMVESVISRRIDYSHCNWELDFPPYDHDDPDDVMDDGIYEGLHLSVVEEMINEEGVEDFADALFDIIKEAQSQIYTNLCDDLLYRHSEEYFIEESRDLDTEFEVEVEDEEEHIGV